MKATTREEINARLAYFGKEPRGVSVHLYG